MLAKKKVSAKCPFRGFDVCLGTEFAIFRAGDASSTDPGSCELRALGEMSKSLMEMRFHQAASGPLQNMPKPRTI